MAFEQLHEKRNKATDVNEPERTAPSGMHVRSQAIPNHLRDSRVPRGLNVLRQ